MAKELVIYLYKFWSALVEGCGGGRGCVIIITEPFQPALHMDRVGTGS